MFWVHSSFALHIVKGRCTLAAASSIGRAHWHPGRSIVVVDAGVPPLLGNVAATRHGTHAARHPAVDSFPGGAIWSPRTKHDAGRRASQFGLSATPFPLKWRLCGPNRNIAFAHTTMSMQGNFGDLVFCRTSASCDMLSKCEKSFRVCAFPPHAHGADMWENTDGPRMCRDFFHKSAMHPFKIKFTYSHADVHMQCFPL